mgnify:CR=1 FL=1
MEAEGRAAKYHQQKGQFLEIVDEKINKEKLREKVKAIRKMENDLRELKKQQKENYKESQRLHRFISKSQEARDEWYLFSKNVCEPINNKIFILEAEIKNAKYGTPPAQDDHVNYGKRGGRYTLERSRNGGIYRKYF